MIYKNIKITGFALITLLAGYTNKARSQSFDVLDFISSFKYKNSTKVYPYDKKRVLNEDSVYINEYLAIISEEKTLEEKQYAILLNVVSHFILSQQDELRRLDGRICELPSVIEIIQERDYKGNSYYYICQNNNKIGDMPTKITKIEDRYVLIRFRGAEPLSEESVPEILLKKECNPKIYIIDDYSWTVLMCKNSTKHITVRDIVNIEDKDGVEYYFDGFSCE